MLDRLVAVAVHQREFIAGQEMMTGDAVSRGIPVEHEECAVGAEHPRGVPLRRADRPGMLQR